MIGPRLAKPVALAMLLLQLSSTFVYAGFLYLPFSKTYAPSVFVYDSYTLNKGWPTYVGHTGTDYRGDGYGTPVYAAADGVVVALRETENDRCDITYAEQLRYGNYVLIEHQIGNNKYRTEYWHLKQNGVVVNVNDRVSVGTLIAYVSNSGLTCGLDCKKRSDLPYGANYHLHFEVKKWNGNRWVVANPYNEETGWLWATNPPSPATGACSIAPGQGSSRQVFFQQAYDRKGGEKVMGCATTAAFWWAGMVRQDFEGSPGFGRAAILHDEPADNPKFSIPAYVVQGGFWGWYKNNSVFGPPASDHYINAFGLPQTDFRDGFIYWTGEVNPRRYLLKGSGPKVYFIERGRKRWVPNSETLFALGYTWSNVQTIPNSALAVFPTGSPLPDVNNTWLAQYYDNMVNRRPAKVIRGEGDLNFGWGLGSPHSLIPKDNFSARFTRYADFPASGRYRFYIVKDDGGRLWIDGEKIFDKWCHTSACVGHFTVDQDISAGTHLVRFDYYEKGVSATARLWWDTLDKEGPQVSASFSSTAQGGSGWYQAPVTVTLSASDPSGVDRIEYRLDGSWQLYKKPVILSGDGVYQFQFRAYDRHGNQSSIYNEQVKIDKTPPKITGAPNKGPNENGWYNEDVTVHFEAEDQLDLSGLKSVTPDTIISTEGKDQEVTGTAEDNAGNMASTTVGGINIDKTTPSSNLDNSVPHHNSFPISIPVIADDSLGLKRVRLYKRPRGSSGWDYHSYVSVESGRTQFSGFFNVLTLSEGEWEFASRAVDIAGNVEDFPVEADISLIFDETPPATELSYDGPTYESEGGKLFVSPATEFKLSADDTNQTDPLIETSGVAQTNYQIDKDEEQIYEGEFPIENEDGKHEIKYQSDDVAGNEEPQKSQEIHLDSTPPTSTDDSDGEWHNEDVAVLIVSSDGEGSGVKAIYYSGAEEGIAEGDQVVVIFENEGVHELSYYAVDNVENIEGEKHAELIKIDETPPTIEGSPDREPNEYGWYNEDVIVHFEAEDQLDLSGLKSVTPDTIISTEGKDQEVTGTAEDNAGNTTSTAVGGINIDKTAPRTTANVTPKEPDGNNGWYRSDVEVTLEVTDKNLTNPEIETSGVHQTDVAIIRDGASENKSYQEWDVALPFEEDGIYDIRFNSEDWAGNVEDPQDIEIKRDAALPEIYGAPTEGPNEYGWYNEDVTVHFEATDNLSGIASVTEDQVVKTEGADQSVEGVAVDMAGNGSTAVVSGINIDKTDPSSEITFPEEGEYYNQESWEQGGGAIIGTASDNLSGIGSVEVEVEGVEEGEAQLEDYGELETGWEYSLRFAGDGSDDGEYTVRSRATDLAGNQESTDEISFVYDATPPAISGTPTGGPNENGWYNDGVVVQFRATDETSGVAFVTEDQVIETEGAGQSVEGVAVDFAGNSSTILVGGINIDQTPPSSQLNELDLYYSNPFELTYTYSDNLSGVERARLYKRVPGEDWGYHGGSSREPSKPFKVGTLSEGRWEFASVVIDYAGNIEVLLGEADTWTIYDITPPTSAITSIEESEYYNAETWPGIFGEADDNLSGVAQVKVRADKDGEEGEWMAAEGSDSWSFDFNLEDGFYTVYSRAVDRAGNQESTFEVSFVYDDASPVTSVELSGTKGLSGWYVSSVTLSLSVDDANPSQTFYLIDDSDPQVYSELLNFEDGEHTLEFWSEDLAGNIEQEQEVTFRIDTVAPSVPVASIPGGTFIEGETLRISLTAEGGAKIYYSLDGGEPILYSGSITIVDDTALVAYAIDEAGNRSASVEFNYVFSAKGAAPAGGQGSALGGNPAPQVLGVQSQETPRVSQGRDLVDGVAGVKGEETSTLVGEPNPKGLGGWEILLVIMLGGVPYSLLRRWIFLKK